MNRNVMNMNIYIYIYMIYDIEMAGMNE